MKQDVINQLKSYAQFNGHELCGILMGSKVGENKYRINKVSPPLVSRHSHCDCERDAVMANQFIKEDYEKSEHTRTYIGEWHTHPVGNPVPSNVDCLSIRDIFRTSLLVTPFLLMVIVGTQSLYFSIYNGNDFLEIKPEIM